MAACKGVVVGVRINTRARSGQATECPVGREWLLFDHGVHHHISFALALAGAITALLHCDGHYLSRQRTYAQPHHTFAFHLKILTFLMYFFSFFFLFLYKI